MKSSQQILGLPVLSLEEGRELGEVRYIILNPAQGTVDFLLIADDEWYLEHKVLPFKDVSAIGEYALTVAAASSLAPVSSSPGALELLKKDLTLPGIRVLTQGGRLVGSISEYYIDPSSGKITACRLLPLNGQRPGCIPRASILTYGSDFLVAVEAVEEQLVQEEEIASQTGESSHHARPGTASRKEAPVPQGKQLGEAKPPKNDQQPEIDKQQLKENQPEGSLPGKDSLLKEGIKPQKINQLLGSVEQGEDTLQGDNSVLKLFEEEQRQYLVGKIITTDILAEDGEAIAREGERVTPEIIDKALAADRYTVLTLSVCD